MRRTLTLTLALILPLAACGGSSDTTRPPDDPPDTLTTFGPPALQIVAGDGQQAPVATLLPAPVEVLVMREPSGSVRGYVGDGLSLSRVRASAAVTGAVPAAGTLVNFVVTDPDCGRPFAGATLTDSAGHALERWELGTRAGTCHMETRAVDQTTGAAVTFDTAVATALPGAVDTLEFVPLPAIVFPGETFDARALVYHAADRYGNMVMRRHLLSTDPPEVAGDLSLTVMAPAGWAANGASVTAPNAPTEAELSMDVPEGAAVRIGLPTIAVVDDLSAHTWHVTTACPSNGQVMGGVPLDSTVFDMTFGPATYRPFAFGAIADVGPLKDVQVELPPIGGTVTQYWHDGSTTDIPYSQVSNLLFSRQAPDRLYWIVSQRGWAEKVSDAPLTYSGGTGLCADRAPLRDFVMVAQ